ncbi:ANTAR domain-containing protein [Streptomyces sp. NBC_00237]|nr:ANTAR domain-containing protein [Streptomyces sp. NBC_00237]
MRWALESRPVIDMAHGVLMAACQCTASQAWQILVEISQHTNIKLRAVGQHIVDSTNGPPPPGPVRDTLQRAAARHTPTPASAHPTSRRAD